MNEKNIFTLTYTNTLSPPPYLYKLDLTLRFIQEQVKVSYKKEYLDRSDFSEEELEEEGFSLHDDVTMDVTLNKAWAGYFNSLLADKAWNHQAPSSETHAFSLTRDDDTISYLVVNNAEYLLEELYQAMLETLNIEAPLSIQIRKNQAGTELNQTLKWQFKDRVVESIHENNSQKWPWEKGQQWLSIIYDTDLSELSIHKKKVPEGKTCIDPGDGVWYEIPTNKAWEGFMKELFL